MNADKLAKLQAQVRIGGKGTVRRKKKAAHKESGGDEKKLQGILKKINTQPIPGIEEVNMFMDEGSILSFKAPKVQTSLASNTFVITGPHEKKDLSELMPGILGQIGPDSLETLKRLADVYSKQVGAQSPGFGVGDFSMAATAGSSSKLDMDDDVPQLVGDFEERAVQDEEKRTTSISTTAHT